MPPLFVILSYTPSFDDEQACERSIELIQAQAQAEWSANEVGKLRKMLRPRIDPRIYRSKTPNFRQLAIKYSSTFGVFVKDEGGYEAKIDFHDADAVRCLAQTLLLDDFGIRATLSPSNLCPMIPNRLAYISLIHELLSWTLPTWHLLHHFQRCPLDATVRGLDIGTGASAIYPVLGAACFAAWRFVGTDIDEGSLEYARQHVVDCAEDEVKGRIALLRVGEDEAYVSGQETGGLDFTMCNPPFYSSRQEMDELARFKKQPANAVRVPLRYPLTQYLQLTIVRTPILTGLSRHTLRNDRLRRRGMFRPAHDPRKSCCTEESLMVDLHARQAIERRHAVRRAQAAGQRG